jgi:hypothetical protein
MGGAGNSCVVGGEMRDIFRPSCDPARSIYDAFQSEARHRKGREFAEWNRAEILAVYIEANRCAYIYNLRAPTMDDVIMAERCASGHVDYGAKWAYGILNVMTNRTAREPAIGE